MKKQKRILVLTIIVACISLVVSLPRIVNADESIYQVMEFLGSSYLSYEDATQNALKAEPSFTGFEVITEEPLEYSDGYEAKYNSILKFYRYEVNEGKQTKLLVLVRVCYKLKHIYELFPSGPGPLGP